MLKVVRKDGDVIYEQQFDEMIESWYLSHDRLVYQEKLNSNKLTYVRLHANGTVEVNYFQLPPELTIKRPMTANFELFVQAHPNEDKDSLRRLI